MCNECAHSTVLAVIGNGRTQTVVGIDIGIDIGVGTVHSNDSKGTVHSNDSKGTVHSNDSKRVKT
jgi:hypothetical protein